jgi:hypothetical protein
VLQKGWELEKPDRRRTKHHIPIKCRHLTVFASETIKVSDWDRTGFSGIPYTCDN